VLSSFGLPPTHAASVLADVLQFVATQMEGVLGKRMVLAVVCGPRDGIGGYLLHGSGVVTCTSEPAMEAVARSVDGVVQALQLVATDTPPSLPREDVDSEEADRILDGDTPPPAPRGSPPPPRAASPPPPSGGRQDSRHAQNASPLASTTPYHPAAPAPTPRRDVTPTAQEAGQPRGGDGGTTGAGGSPHSGLPVARATPLPALIPWLTVLPERLRLSVLIDGKMQPPPPPIGNTKAPYVIPSALVKKVKSDLMAHNAERAGGFGARLTEFVPLYRHNVITRTGVKYTFENVTPDLVRGVNIKWYNNKKEVSVTDPRLANTALFRIPNVFAVVLLMLYVEDPAFMTILRHYKGGALIEDTETTSKKNKKRKVGRIPHGGRAGAHGADGGGAGANVGDGGDTEADDQEGGGQDGDGDPHQGLQGEGAVAGQIADPDANGRGVDAAPDFGASAGAGASLGGGAGAGHGGAFRGRGSTAADHGGERVRASRMEAAVGSDGDGADTGRGDRLLPGGTDGAAAGRGSCGAAARRGGGRTSGRGGEASTWHGGRAPIGHRGGAAAGRGGERAASGPWGRGRGRTSTVRGGAGAVRGAGDAAMVAAADSAAAAAAAAGALAAAEDMVAPLVATSVRMDGTLVGTGSICPNLDEYHGASLRSDVVSVFLEQLAPGASSLEYPFALHPEYCLEPTGVGPVRTTLAQCGNMARSVWSLASIGYVQSPLSWRALLYGEFL